LKRSLPDELRGAFLQERSHALLKIRAAARFTLQGRFER
jgi:hypothetical protein